MESDNIPTDDNRFTNENRTLKSVFSFHWFPLPWRRRRKQRLGFLPTSITWLFIFLNIFFVWFASQRYILVSIMIGSLFCSLLGGGILVYRGKASTPKPLVLQYQRSALPLPKLQRNGSHFELALCHYWYSYGSYRDPNLHLQQYTRKKNSAAHRSVLTPEIKFEVFDRRSFWCFEISCTCCLLWLGGKCQQRFNTETRKPRKASN